MRYQDRLTICERALHWSRDMMASLETGFVMDEVALLFENAAELDSFTTWARDAAGLEHFNTVLQDTMARQDRLGAFEVRFEFLRFPGADWRIEAMCVLDGDAPLHEKHLRLMGNGALVHASFKLPDLDTYDDAVVELQESGMARMAEYQNTYGVFSYWETLEALHYFKPRVNLQGLVEKL